MDFVERLGHFLEAFFHTEFYRDGAARARAYIAEPGRAEEWDELAAVIRARRLPEGQALALVAHRANQVLDENSDDEAYAWLDLMVHNIEGDSPIQPY